MKYLHSGKFKTEKGFYFTRSNFLYTAYDVTGMIHGVISENKEIFIDNINK